MNSFPNMMLRFCQIFGGLPLESKGTKGIKTLKFSVTGFLWGATLVLLQQALSFVGLYLDFFSSHDGPLKLKVDMTTLLTSILDVVSLQVMAAVLFFSCAWKYPRLVDVCDTLEKVYRSLQQTSLEVKVRDKVVVICTYTFLLSLTITDHVMCYGTLFRIVLAVMTFLPTLLFYSAQLAFYVSFTHFVQSITNCFKIVNAKIKEEITTHVFQRMAIYKDNHANGDVTNQTFKTVETPFIEFFIGLPRKRTCDLLVRLAAVLWMKKDVEREKKRGLTSPSTFLTNHSSVATSPLGSKALGSNLCLVKEIHRSVKQYVAVGVVELLLLPPICATNLCAGRFLSGSSILATVDTIQQVEIELNVYWLLCDAVHKADEFYSDQLLAVVFSSFVHITITSYFFFLHVTRYEHGDLFLTVTLAAWALAHICYVVLLMTACTDVTNSAEESAAIICNLVNKDLDPNLREQVMLTMPIM
ncbi:hypothetical protein J6590_060255 [Homalodisca vitripennis]|nr:hypothetical protein J6590_060255 [Homalodisca vitripennis]